MYTEGLNLRQSLSSVNRCHLIVLPKVWHFGTWKLKLNCWSFFPPLLTVKQSPPEILRAAEWTLKKCIWTNFTEMYRLGSLLIHW